MLLKEKFLQSFIIINVAVKLQAAHKSFYYPSSIKTIFRILLLLFSTSSCKCVFCDIQMCHSPPRMFYKIGIPKNFTKLTGKN